MRTLWTFQKYGSTFHGYAQNPLFKGILGVSDARGRFTKLPREKPTPDPSQKGGEMRAGMAFSPKNGERLAENGDRIFLGTAISAMSLLIPLVR